MRKQSIASISAAIALALAAGGAQAAGTKNDTFNVNANVASNCFITAADMNFGDYDGTAVVDSTSTVSVRCSKNADFDIALSVGTTLGGTYAQRLMAGPGGDTLQYNLYTPAGFGTIWGNNSPGTGWVSGTGTGLGNTLNFTVNGRIPDTVANQAASVGAYQDVITATITY
jgi:spore coat protein U-like protein